ncbi:MAG: alpha/beta hydrolase [Vulcanimicrobiota bacterium]
MLRLLLVLLVCTAAWGQSPEALDYYRGKTAPKPLVLKTPADWEAFQKAAPPDREKLKASYPYREEALELGGVRCLSIGGGDKPSPGVILHFHGGGYVKGSSEGSLTSSVPLAHFSHRRVIAFDYRLAPQHPYPAALEDSLAVYTALLDQYPADQIAFSGSSAGAGLALTTVFEARRRGLPGPAALGLQSPWCDLTASGDTLTTLAGVDPIIHYQNNLKVFALAYAGGRQLSDPKLSPIYERFGSDFPPSLIQSGTRDLLLSLSVRLYRRLRASGAQTTLSVWDGVAHGFYTLPGLPEAKEANRELGEFIATQLDKSTQRKQAAKE